eukprot:7948433-Pyramimonas_sp.AAC.1
MGPSSPLDPSVAGEGEQEARGRGVGRFEIGPRAPQQEARRAGQPGSTQTLRWTATSQIRKSSSP